jgi:hypothetical protein
MPRPGKLLSVSLAGFLALVLLLGGCSSTSQTNQPDPAKKDSGLLSVFNSTKPITVPEGTALHVVLDQSLSSANSHSGEEFEATVSDPIVI